MKGGEELDDLDAYIAAALTDPAFARAWQHAAILDMPRLTRLRWWCTEHIDTLCCWLCDRGQWRAAQAIWRLSGLWQAARRAK